MIKIILLLSVIFICAILPKFEHFTINDFYSKYLNDISVPADFYGFGKVANGFKLAEVNDRFFIDTLNAVKTKIEDKDYQTTQEYPKNILERSKDYLTKILNAKLPKGDVQLFNSVYNSLENVKKKKDDYLVSSKHVIHRDNKIYGTSLEMVTFQNKDKIELVDFKLIGFIFDDKLNAVQPSNIDESDYQDYMRDKTFVKDKKYEKQYLCRYYRDLEKFRGLKIKNDLDCSEIDI